MSGFVVIVEFRLKPGMRPAFRELIDANARDSVRKEPGCRRFDVTEPQDRADTIILYEIYDNRVAFENHARTEHYMQFDAASADLVTKKTVAVCDLVCEGSA